MQKVKEIKGHLYVYDTDLRPKDDEWRYDEFGAAVIRHSTGQYQYKVIGSSNPVLNLPLKPEDLINLS